MYTPALHYTSALQAACVCLSVCLSVRPSVQSRCFVSVSFPFSPNRTPLLGLTGMVAISGIKCLQFLWLCCSCSLVWPKSENSGLVGGWVT